MDYKRKYEQAMLRMNKWVEGSEIIDPKEVAEFVFPELKESEDERVRKALTHYFSEQDGILTAINGSVSVRDILAWLEKQGEQKPVDKVEPKFKVGDWVQIDGGHVMKILDVKKDVLCYRILNWCGNESVRNISDIDSIAHLWTIEDAKDGDVLAVNWYDNDNKWEKIVLFKHFHQNGTEYFCQPSIEGYGNTFKNGELAWKDENVPYYSQTWTSTLRPATKEQCDLLFSKMKEAGYEWSDKELKNIEQKPNFCHHEVDLSNCSEEYRKAYYDGWNNCNQQHAQLEAEQKPAWSKEDEYNLNWIINDYERASQTAISSVWEGRFKMFVDWLKSLKERMKG